MRGVQFKVRIKKNPGPHFWKVRNPVEILKWPRFPVQGLGHYGLIWSAFSVR